MRHHLVAGLLLLPLISACGPDLASVSSEDEETDTAEGALCSRSDVDGLTENSAEALGVLRVANQADLATLRNGVRLTKSAAQNLLARRNGADGTLGTADDRPFTSLSDLSSVCSIGSSAIHSLMLWAMAHPGTASTDAGTVVVVVDAGVAVVDAGVPMVDPLFPCTGAMRLPTTGDLVFQSGSQTAFTRTCDSWGVCTPWAKEGGAQSISAWNGPRSLFVNTSGSIYLQARVGLMTSSQSGSSTYLCSNLDLGSGSVDPTTGIGVGHMTAGYRCDISGGSGGPSGSEAERTVDIHYGASCVSLTDQVTGANYGVQRRRVTVLWP